MPVKTSSKAVVHLCVSMVRRIHGSPSEDMLRGVRFFCRPYLSEECRILSNDRRYIFGSSRNSSLRFDAEKKKRKNTNTLTLKNEILTKNKLKYEDTFGDIEKFQRIFQTTKDDPEDVLEYERDKAAKGKTIIEYLREIKSLLKKHDYKNAIKVLEVDMVNDKKPANQFIYRILINYNALAGNLEEAYRLFLRFKERQGVVNGAMYTSMFNACANCQNSFLAIEKAKAVRECMQKNKHHAANIANYNVMLKAFGRHGDIMTCFKIMDEVLEKKDKVRDETYVFLLQACASDSNSGLRLGLLAWRKMLQNKVKPNVFSFNTMLRCVRDCSLGDALLIPDLMQEVIEESKIFYRRKVKMKTIGYETKRTVTKIPTDGSGMITPVEVNSSQFQVDDLVKIPSDAESSLETAENRESLPEPGVQSTEIKYPNFLALEPSFGSAIKFGVMTEPYHRLMLVGGVKGFLHTMAEFGVKPNIKTFTLLLQIIPSTLEAETELMSLVGVHNVKFDINFFNVLIKKRIFRNDSDSVKDCLEQINAFGLHPDIFTFGTLALNCHTYESAKELLEAIKNNGFSPNPPILNALLKNATYTGNINHIISIVRAAKEDGSKLDSKFVSTLSNFVKKNRDRLKDTTKTDKHVTQNLSHFENQES